MRTGEIVGGRYEIGRLAAAGGMGAVFRARDRFSGATVAIKVLLDAPRGQDEVRFEREAQALADLRHPGIVQYIARGVTPSGEPYFVMEWLDGEDLDSRLKRERLTVDESMGLVSRIAEALGAAHSRGIIHRDLKPGNVLLVDRRIDRVKLLDFGIAHLVGVTPMTHTGMLLGTPGYMAPEQARGKEILTARVDVFALGCLLFECLTGVPAFVGDQALALLGKILFDEAPRVRELSPEVPKTLDALVARMLEKDPKRRPRDGTAVVELMREIGMSTTETGRPSSFPSPQLSANERRLISILLIEKERSIELATTWRADVPEVPAEQEELLRVSQERGGRTAVLADGTVIVTMMGSGIATDQAIHAARCALELRAIAKGRTMALSMGRGDLQGKRPMGDTIDRAAQILLNRGLPDAIAIDEMTAALLDIRFEVTRVEGGFILHHEHEQPQLTWRRGWLGKSSPCVGRNRELSILDGLFVECLEEPMARAALISAPAGMGKSRLAREWLCRLHDRWGPVEIWIARGDSLRSELPFGLLGQVIRAACGMGRSDPIEVRRSKLAQRIARHVPPANQARIAAILGEICDTPLQDPPEPQANRLDSQLMTEQIREACEEFLRAECTAQAVLVVLEELHWSDSPTVRLLDTCLRHLKPWPLMILALARPDVHELFPRLWIERGLLEIRLGELSRKASERLVRQELGEAVDPATVEHIVARADGHSYYLEELIRTADQRRPDELPDTIVALAQSRIEALESEERRILRAASIFGERFWQSGVSLLLGVETPIAQATDWLAGLVDQGLLVRIPESRFPGEVELAFRPALLRDGAYAMLTDQDRILGHRLAAGFLERHGENDLTVLAEHMERGRQPLRAGSYFLQAAQRAARSNHSDTSIRLACRGLSCASPDSVRIGLLSLLTESHSRRREWTAVAPHRDELARLSLPGTPSWITAMVSKSMEAAHEGNLSELSSHLHALRQVTPERGGAGTMALASALSMFGSMGRFDAARAVLTDLCIPAEPPNGGAPIERAWTNAVDAYQHTFTHEDPWMGLQNAGAALAIFKDAGDVAGTVLSRVSCGMNYWFLGLLGRAERELRDTPVDGEELGEVCSLRAGLLAGVLTDRGALEDAHREANRLVEGGRERQVAPDEGRGRWVRAEILRRAGELDEAEREASMAIDLLQSVPLDALAATATLSAILLGQGRASDAREKAVQVMAKYEAWRAFGYRGAYARLVHAQALHATGDHEMARAAVGVARERLLASAAKIGDADVRTDFLRNVPENARILELAREWLGEARDEA